jgi:dihydroxyacid dehydratase/phosphogluconate dehydratase
MPGSVMAMGRLNRPIMVYGGSIHSGKWKGESLNSLHLKLGVNTITQDLKE